MIRRRWWIVLLAAVAVSSGAVAYSLQQEHRYEASADVVVTQENLASALTGVPGVIDAQDPQRLIETQARLARTPTLAAQVLEAVPDTGLTPQDLLDTSSVSSSGSADVLTFWAQSGDRETAVRLATEYARQFTAYRGSLDEAALTRGVADLRGRIDDVRSRGGDVTTLEGLLEQLRTVQALGTSNAILVRPATIAEQVQPRLLRNGLVALVLGILLGVGLAFLRETLDSKVRASDEVAELLELPLLGRVPRPPRAQRRSNALITLDDPLSYQSDVFRMLRTSIDFGNANQGPRTIMVTSAAELEGKSTTIANLAVAYARAGKRVALVDLDLRRPSVHSSFELPLEPGVTEVAFGRVPLEAALHHVAVPWSPQTPVRSVALVLSGDRVASGNGDRLRPAGTVDVLTAGMRPPEPGDFIGSNGLLDVLAGLRERCDVVLVDTPPILSVDETMVLSEVVDGVLVVLRLGALRRSTVKDLRRALDLTPARKLGFVLTDADSDHGRGYGYGHGDGNGPARFELKPARKRALP